MSLSDSKATAVYQEAIQRTADNWDDQGVGYTGRNTSGLATATSRQLNTLLYVVIKQTQIISELKDELTQIHSRVKTIESKLGQTPSPPSLKTELDSINSKISKIQNIQRSQPKKEESSGRIKVFQDPYNLLRRL